MIERQKILLFIKQLKELEKFSNYYEFVHKILPKFFFISHKYFIKALKGGECPLELMVTGLRQILGEDFNKFTPKFYWFGKITNETVGFVLKMREPERITEPYFVAFVFHPEDESFTPRYFVLEKHFGIFEDSPKAVLCEWTEDGVHKNYMEVRIKRLNIKDFYKGIETILNFTLIDRFKNLLN